PDRGDDLLAKGGRVRPCHHRRERPHHSGARTPGASRRCECRSHRHRCALRSAVRRPLPPGARPCRCRRLVPSRACARLRRMRWLVVLPFERPGFMGMDFADEIRHLGHEVRTFPYRRENALYKNRSTKAAYQRVIGAKLERVCVEWRPTVVLVIKGSPIFPALIRRIRVRTGALFLDLFFVKDHYARRSLESVGVRNLYYLPLYCVPAQHHPVTLSEDEAARYGAP